jgi:surfactin synthase thioesterase subunit
MINIICLPFAGGSKYSYRKLEENLPPYLSFTTVEYPGHGARSSEELCTQISELALDAIAQKLDKIKNGNYAIYGHSMGGIVGYEMIRNILRLGLRPPLHFFVTGTTGPSSPTRSERKWHELSKSDFMEKLKELDGCPEEIFIDQDLFDYFEPILRADFLAIANYTYSQSIPFDVPISVITGSYEIMEDEHIRLWQMESIHKVNFSKLPGKHFFINHEPISVVKQIVRDLEVYKH